MTRALAKKIAKAQWHYATAFNSRERASWSPGTATAHRDLARYDKHRALAEALMTDVMTDIRQHDCKMRGGCRTPESPCELHAPRAAHQVTA